MKDNMDVMAGIVGMMGALMKAIKKKFTTREVIVNMIVAGVLSFGAVGAMIYFLPKYIHDVRVMIPITFFLGWLSNTFTDKLEQAIGDIYELGMDWLRSKSKTDKPKNENTDEE